MKDEHNAQRLPLKKAYDFGKSHGLEREVAEISSVNPDVKYPSWVRRAYMVELLERNGHFEDFKKRHWSRGNKESGKNHIRRCREMKDEYERSGKAPKLESTTKREVSRSKNLESMVKEQTPDLTFLTEEVSSPSLYPEGAVQQVSVNAYERNPEARLECIKAHGTACCICGFSFASVYGPEAEGYIHVHHLRPLSEVGGEYEVDPVEDLRPLCPNCHAVVHLGGRCRTIEEVRQMLEHTGGTP